MMKTVTRRQFGAWCGALGVLALGSTVTGCSGAGRALAAGGARGPVTAAAPCDAAALLADLAARDLEPQTEVAADQWYTRPWNGGWGPRPRAYAKVAVPDGCDALAWQRERVVAVAQHYLGLAYRHHHIPAWAPSAALVGADKAGAGLDCSNYTAWVYNYGLGIQFTSDVQEQADGPKAPGRRLADGEPYAPGDLLFILRQDRAEISHVVLWIDAERVIDSHGTFGGVTVHPLQGWYRTHLSHARRVLE